MLRHIWAGFNQGRKDYSMTAKKTPEKLSDVEGLKPAGGSDDPTPSASSNPDYTPGAQPEPRPEDYHPNARVTPPDEQLNPAAATSVGQLVDPKRDADDDSPANDLDEHEAAAEAAVETGSGQTE
jgi:hypothetical protein